MLSHQSGLLLLCFDPRSSHSTIARLHLIICKFKICLQILRCFCTDLILWVLDLLVNVPWNRVLHPWTNLLLHQTKEEPCNISSITSAFLQAFSNLLWMFPKNYFKVSLALSNDSQHWGGAMADTAVLFKWGTLTFQNLDKLTLSRQLLSFSTGLFVCGPYR